MTQILLFSEYSPIISGDGVGDKVIGYGIEDIPLISKEIFVQQPSNIFTRFETYSGGYITDLNNKTRIVKLPLEGGYMFAIYADKKFEKRYSKN